MNIETMGWVRVVLMAGLLAVQPLRAQPFTLQHEFSSTPDGANPQGLVLSSNTFFGATYSGGGFVNGTLFKFNADGSGYTNFFSFNNLTNGSLPNNLLVAGNLIFGTTQNGGSNSFGTAFSVGTDGSGFTRLHTFTTSPDAQYPRSGLTLGGATLYGTTSAGGTNGQGTIFKLGTNGTGYTILRSFTNSPDGSAPRATLLLNNATLYGTSYSGGTYGNGGIFKLNTNGSGYSVIYSFSNYPDGQFPEASLILYSNQLYGTTGNGGSTDYGTIFTLNTNGGGYTVLHNFTGPTVDLTNSDGSTPSGSLMANNGFLFGSALGGGANNKGTLFMLRTDGSGFSVLRSFGSAPDGANPRSSLILVSNVLWGTTYSGGNSNFGTTFSVGLNPFITQQPSNLTVTNGTTASFTASVTNASGGLSYQWYFNTNSLLVGQTNNPLNLAAVTTNQAGYYTLIVTNQFGSVTSTPALLTVLFFSKPTITAQPQNLNVTNGNPANFSVTANGAGVLSYQWYFNTNTLLVGQTATNLLIASATTNDAGYYSVAISNSFGIVTSSAALLTIVVPTKPSISAPPQSLVVTNGNPANFSVTASGPDTLSYQWYFNTNNLLGGQNATNYFIASANPGQAGFYTVTVSNSFGIATSSPAQLTVLVFSKPTITAQPQSLNVTNGNPANFSVTANGAGALSYQWYFNTNTLLVGQTATNLLIASAATNNVGAYTVVVSNFVGTVTSSPAQLSVTVFAKPTISAQPQSLNVTNGTPANFSVTASGDGTLSYQWYFNTNTVLVGQNATNLFLASTATNNAGKYSVIVSNFVGTVTSSFAVLTVTASTIPVILVQPPDQSVVYTNVINVSVTAIGQSPLTYQWYSNSTSAQVFTLAKRLTDKTNATFAITANFTNVSYYSVIIGNSLGKATSSAAMLTVIAAPLITTNPSPVSVFSGDPVNFNVGVLGASTLRYQWYFNTNALLTNQLGNALVGRTNNPLTFTTASNGLIGRYSVIITNTFGRATSSPALLTIASGTPPIITLQPLNQTITNGAFVSFTSAANGTNPLSYQWLFNTNQFISGATNTTLTFATANQPGIYSMRVTNTYGAATSTPALLTVVGQPLMLTSTFDPVSGSYSFSYANLAGSTNRLWATTNLATTNFWKAIATNVMATNALWFFTDVNTAATNAARFYRFSTP